MDKQYTDGKYSWRSDVDSSLQVVYIYIYIFCKAIYIYEKREKKRYSVIEVKDEHNIEIKRKKDTVQ